MKKSEGIKEVQIPYGVLRIAQELESSGDLATNVAERVIYIVIGEIHEEIDLDDAAE